MRTISRAMLFAAAAALSACATSYGPSGMSGGFTDVRLDENVFRVSFQGNGFTSQEAVQEMALLRCAELTLTNGFSFFVVGAVRDATQQVTNYTPVQTNTTGTLYGNRYSSTTTTTGGQPMTFNFASNTTTILTFKERPQGMGITYDAKRIVESLGPKYKKS